MSQLLQYFVALLLAGAAFVWLTCSTLPPVVASHFGVNGAANGSMSRAGYSLFMVGFVIGLPTLIALSGRLAGILPAHMVNLPNREVWLAPERRSATVTALSHMMQQLAMALVVFLCFTHGLVIRANATQPAHLDQLPFFAGLGLFFLVVAVWISALFSRFHRTPDTEDAGRLNGV